MPLLLLEHAQVPNIHTFEVYRKHGGYKSLEKVLKTMSPEQVVDEVKKVVCVGEVGQVFLPG